MQDKLRGDQKDLADLIALMREIQGEKDARGEVNELNVLLLDFARELLKRRVLARVEFVRLMEPPSARVGIDQVFSKHKANSDH